MTHPSCHPAYSQSNEACRKGNKHQQVLVPVRALRHIVANVCVSIELSCGQSELLRCASIAGRAISRSSTALRFPRRSTYRRTTSSPVGVHQGAERAPHSAHARSAIRFLLSCTCLGPGLRGPWHHCRMEVCVRVVLFWGSSLVLLHTLAATHHRHNKPTEAATLQLWRTVAFVSATFLFMPIISECGVMPVM